MKQRRLPKRGFEAEAVKFLVNEGSSEEGFFVEECEDEGDKFLREEVEVGGLVGGFGDFGWIAH